MATKGVRSKPSEFRQERADKICNRLAGGMSLRKICEIDGMPSRETVRNWRLVYPEFNRQYHLARQDQADYWADEIVDIADEAKDVQLARLRVDARKWIACKLHPRAYGDRQAIELSGHVSYSDMTDEELENRIANFAAQQAAED